MLKIMGKLMPTFLSKLSLVSAIAFMLFASTTFAITAKAQARPLRIAVAANFAPALKILLNDMPNKEQFNLQIISAATGTLYLQIKHGAPFDLFLSADATRPELLEKSHLTLENSRKTYALGQIALWSATQPISHLNTLTHYEGKLAIANPDTAPYGLAAQQALTYLSLWPAIKSNLITGININQTFQQVRSQSVPLGIVANSQLVMNQLNGVIIPTNYYQPITQQLVIIKTSRQIALAKKISDYILQSSSQVTLQSLGYLAVTSSNPLDEAKR
jgi:molybdate transport system substrate-binding protein